MTIWLSFGGLCLLIALGKLLRVKVGFLRKLYLPSSVIGGLLGLLVLQVFGKWIPADWTAGWSRLPGMLINVVFAALFLGVAIPSIGTIWRKSAPQLAYGQIVAWGQYVVGLGLTVFLLTPLFGVSPLMGVIVPVGFEGGHGTAGGLGPTFKELGWSEGLDYGLASATVGIISAIVVGMALINWAARRGILGGADRLEGAPEDQWAGVYPVDKRPEAGRQTVVPESLDSLALHLAIVGIAILAGVAIKQALVYIEMALPAMRDRPIMRAFPLFPLCMLGGLLVQLVISRFAKTVPVDRGLVQRVGGTALDFLVVAAVATIRLEVIAAGFVPFLIIVTGGILWNVFCVLVLARRLLPDAWFARAIAEMGQSMGVTATGLLLLRVADPESKTEAPSAFAYKQLLHEPFMGGGLWTSTAVLLVVGRGPRLVLGVSVTAIAVWLLIWFLLLRPRGMSRKKETT